MRVLLMSLITRIAKWKDPRNGTYDSVEWRNILYILNAVRWFVFQTLKWAEIKHVYSCRGRDDRTQVTPYFYFHFEFRY